MKKTLVLALAVIASASYADTYYYTGGPVSIPAGVNTSGAGSAGVNLTISAVPALTSISSVSITLSHSWVGDLRATLTNVASGQTVVLFSRIGRATPNDNGSLFGDSSNFDGTYTFAATGSDLVAVAAATGDVAIAPGTYFSSDMHTSTTTSVANGFFAGSQLASDWVLNVSDWAAGDDAGLITAYSIEASPVPEPATMAALGLGVAVLLRRRKKA